MNERPISLARPAPANVRDDGNSYRFDAKHVKVKASLAVKQSLVAVWMFLLER